MTQFEELLRGTRFDRLARADFLRRWANRTGRLGLSDMFAAIVAVLHTQGDDA